ncbi:MerR family transcriptional regulator [Eubacterium limosum]|uniref:MerR family transcriptional regulator n=1 Tax=Eubacterium limosum TaxID=1736 RepID=UPI001559D83C|nr:MerR family transcriptional regulator [Eubacterium limosum]
MQIKEACRCCRLTKKSIQYYEEKTLICPRKLENGYRDYSQADIQTLKEIAVLRSLGLNIREIKGILESADKKAILKKYQYLSDLKQERLEFQRESLVSLAADYDIEKFFQNLHICENEWYTVKERLLLAFPGNYGLFIALHFGKFLNGKIDTDEKRAAYRAILEYLDSIEFYLDSELSSLLEEITSDMDPESMAEETSQTLDTVCQDIDTYIAENGEAITAYLKYKKSDSFQKTPAARLERGLREFQNESGYTEVFIHNMERLSPEYRAYLARLKEADQLLTEKFPEAEDLYRGEM